MLYRVKLTTDYFTKMLRVANVQSQQVLMNHAYIGNHDTYILADTIGPMITLKQAMKDAAEGGHYNNE
jgi:hypothetical protein